MPRKKVAGTALAKINQPTRDVMRPLADGQRLVRVDAVFHVPSVRPIMSGPWSGEADKIAWTDEETGYGCIIRRSPSKGYLGGYVSIPATHPLCFGVQVVSA